jgi:biopolymer transport protein ExbD
MRRSKQQDVEMQITPMLDMAFQLLTFFILTYQPAPTEGQFSMNLIPAAPSIDMDAQAPAAEQSKAAAELPAALRTLTTSVFAGPDGQISRITLGENEYPTLEQLKARLVEIVSDESLPFDQAVIQADPGLSWDALIRVVDVFAGKDVNLTKLSFTELGPNAAAL